MIGRRGRAGCLAGAAIATLGLSAPAWGGPGDLDPDFSRDGKRAFAAGRCKGGASAAVSQGRMVVVGGAAIRARSGRCKTGLVRLLPDGSIDESFADRGLATQTPRSPNAIAVGPGGTIYAGGDSRVTRLRASGEVDPAFGDNGTVELPRGFRVASLAAAGDGGVVIGGTTLQAQVQHPVIARLNPSGNGDPRFGESGFVVSGHRAVGEGVTAILLQDDGKIVAGGAERTAGGPGFAIARFLPDGGLDPGFSDDGIIEFIPSDSDYLIGSGHVRLALQEDGRIVAAGPIGNRVGVARVTAAGAPDPAFAGDGLTKLGRFFAINSNTDAEGVAVTPRGSIVIAATASRRRFPQRSFPYLEHGEFAVAGLTAAGVPDPSFAGGGLTHTDLFTGDDRVTAAALDRTGAWTVVGTAETRGFRRAPVVTRFLTAGRGSDADADGVSDHRDRCPQAYGRVDHGCPQLPRTIDLRYSFRADRFGGTVRSAYSACADAKGSVVRIFERRSAGMVRIASDAPNVLGRFGFRYGAPRGDFIAKIGPTKVPDRGTCAEARSAVRHLP